jgi:haloalkane dehalogenase
MKVLRTDDTAFVNLPDFDYEPRYLDVAAGDGTDDTLRVHYLDEGPRDGPPVLLLHGEPSWSFLYRHMIPVIVAAGLRAIAPDLVGFGRSDKPAARGDYTYQRHVAWMTAVIEHLDLADTTLVGQDWGGLIGLRIVAEHPDRFSRVVAANTFLPTGDHDLGDAFRAWREFSQAVPEFPVGAIVNGGCTTDLSPDVIAGYDAPFPDESYKEGARQFPVLVPASPDDPAAPANRAAWEVLRAWDKPVLCAFSDQDPITKGADQVLRDLIPGARGQSHTVIEGGGHFVQEDRGRQLAEVVVQFVRADG